MSQQHDIKLQSGYTYHLIIQGNNYENIFQEEKNYTYFLKRYWERLSPLMDTFAFCLMPNHLHLLVKIKPYLALHQAAPFYFSKPISAQIVDRLVTL